LPGLATPDRRPYTAEKAEVTVTTQTTPQRVRTFDGAEWELRATTQTGTALYAIAGAPECCPPSLMATLAELAEHGIQSTELAAVVAELGALPMPAGPEPRTVLDRARNALKARMTKDDLRLVLQNVVTYTAELEAERHTTNEALSDAAEQLRANRDRIARLEKAAVEGRAALASFCHDVEDPGTAALGALYLLQQATVGAPMQPGETVPKVYRASHDSIVMGLYTTAAEARKHCEAAERRTWAKFEQPSFDWIEDEEDGVAEMTVWVGGEECMTGFVVTALEVASAYNEEVDE